MAPVCHHFVQNAWRKDLCSNCFKSKEEHGTPLRSGASVVPQGILRDSHQPARRSKGVAVRFPAEESLVIGFGGEECFSSDEGEENSEPAGDSPAVSDDEEDRALQRLTQSNTDLNTSRPYSALLLGQPRRETLLVTVKPFGDTDKDTASRIPVIKSRAVTRTSAFSSRADLVEKLTVVSEVQAASGPNNGDEESDEGLRVDSVSNGELEEVNVEVASTGEVPRVNAVLNKLGTEEVPRVNSVLYKPSNEEVPSVNSVLHKLDSEEIPRVNSVLHKLGTEEVPRVNSVLHKPSNEEIPRVNSVLHKLGTEEVPRVNSVLHKLGTEEVPRANSVLHKVSSEEVPKVNSVLHKLNREEVPRATSVVQKLSNEEVLVASSVIRKPSNEEVLQKLSDEEVTRTSSDVHKFSNEEASSQLLCETHNSEVVYFRESEDSKVNSHKMQIKFGGGCGVYKKVEEPICTLSVRKLDSRELAGEPDGRADSDDPPELPRSPPPAVEPRPSFLHGLVQRKIPPVMEKPKVPEKPSKVLQSRKTQPVTVTPATPEPIEVEACRTPKRQAPKPPTPPTEESSSLFTRNPSAGHCKSSSPVTREKEKRGRAVPEPAPRTSLSLSAESLAAEVDKKRRARFSLRRFLRLGHSKDDERLRAESDIPVIVPLPRPRLEIIHPSDLNGVAVEVVGCKSNVEDTVSTSSGSTDSKETEIMSCDSNSSAGSPGRPAKPPPPPRNWGKPLEGLNKPARPPPPKSAVLLRQQKQAAVHTPPPAPTNNVYANLVIVAGEVRSALAPNKPQRTASIRDANADTPKRKATGGTHSEDSGYESVELVDGKPTAALTASENMYESVRSRSPECDMTVVKASSRHDGQHRRSDSTIDTSPEFLKFRRSFVRSTSLPYCGSETESDIYSPYSFYGSEEDDADWPSTTSRLKLRKGRSVVHTSLEDNYGAVIVANHEALSQVLEQVNMGTTIPVALRGLKTAVNLCWTDFVVPDESRAVVVGRRTFHQAQWSSHQVTLCLAVDQGLQSGLPTRGGSSMPVPITEFSDLVPCRYLSVHSKGKGDLIQAWVTVLTKLQVDTIQSYGCSLRDKGDEHWKDGTFIMLQLINGLKLLQARGIEEAPVSLSSFVLCREERDPQPRLCVLHELNAESDASLCRCALVAVPELLPPSLPLARLVGDLLTEEKAGSLSRVKSILEFSLWGPADIALGAPIADRELALQRWLDLERATVLNGLVRTRIDLTPFEECHLLFLVRTNSKMMNEASLLLDSYKSPHSTTF
ncbi:uncharacterized protein [Anabrus simplex]|uniref:uncharacterized protein isoform X2 n=1 Tax=Anabrus simplex TaxID=316456 RepID=UPI0035A34866